MQQDELHSIRSDLQRVITILDGDQRFDQIGMRARLRKVEEDLARLLLVLEDRTGASKVDVLKSKVEELEDMFNKYRWIVYGIGLGLGVTSIGSIGSLILQIVK